MFAERRPRFRADELSRGWHVQYNTVAPNAEFVRDPATLTRYDPQAVKRDLQVTHRDSVRWAATEIEAADLRRQLSEAETRLGDERAPSDPHAALLRQSLAEAEAQGADERATLARRLEETEAQLAANRAVFDDVVMSLRRELADRLGSIDTLEHALESERTLAAERLRVADAELLFQKSHAAARHHGDTEELLKARAELQALHASKSWLVTRPLRAAYRILRPESGTSGPATGSDRTGIDWGALARESPFSSTWGLDRGTPVDRHYIAKFLNEHSADIRGHVLEMKNTVYTQRFGGSGVTQSSVLDVDASNRFATVVGDLSGTAPLSVSDVDCFLLTQTLHTIYDVRSALRQSVRVLRPGGVLLCTLPAVSRVNYKNGGLDSGDYWRLTQAAVRRLFEELPGTRDLDIRTYGNVRTCTAFLFGLAAEELTPEALDFHDPWFPLIHAVRIVKVL